MKNMIKTLEYSILLAAAVVSAAACSEKKMDEINADNGHTLDATAKFIIPDLELRLAQNVVGGDFNTYFEIYCEQGTGSWNQLYNAERRTQEVTSSSTFNNGWADVYTGILNAKTVIAKTKEGGTDVDDMMARGIGHTMLAIYGAAATDIWGDTPYSQAGDYEHFIAPKADKQEDIYKDVLAQLDSALLCFANCSNTVGSQDLLYNGNASKWTMFVNGLKARYTLRIVGRAADRDKALNDVLDYAASSYKSAADQATITYDGNNQNPVFDLNWSIDAISSSKSMFDKLMERHDPRAERVYFDAGAWIHYYSDEVEELLPEVGKPNQCQYVYPYDVFRFAEVAPIYILSYKELCFIEAEAYARLGIKEAAEECLKEGIKEAFASLEINVAGAMNAPSLLVYGGLDDISEEALTDEDAADYYEASVAPLFEADPIKEIMIQKYIALWDANGGSAETYNDVRRIKYLDKDKDIYGFQHPQPEKFPLRAPYGNDDVVNNPNISPLYTDGGRYVFTEPVWWAGGSR